MKINKDEARILSSAMNDFIFEIMNKYKIDGLFDSLTELTNKLEDFGNDKRRTGRTSQNDYSDLIKRYANKNRNQI